MAKKSRKFSSKRERVDQKETEKYHIFSVTTPKGRQFKIYLKKKKATSIN